MNGPSLGPKRDTTSAILDRLLRGQRNDQVTLGWIVEQLGERSFGIVMLLVALAGLVPGVSPVAGIVLALPAIQMIRAHHGPVLPRFVATRHLSTRRLARLIGLIVPLLRRMETFVHPRWATPFEATKRVVGFVILLLCPTLLVPLPFSHVIPALSIMLLAFAFLEEDGMLLCLALAGAAISLAITAATVWGTIEAGRFL